MKTSKEVLEELKEIVKDNLEEQQDILNGKKMVFYTYDKTPKKISAYKEIIKIKDCNSVKILIYTSYHNQYHMIITKNFNYFMEVSQGIRYAIKEKFNIALLSFSLIEDYIIFTITL